MSDGGDRSEQSSSSLNNFIDKYEMFVYTPVIVTFNFTLFGSMTGAFAVIIQTSNLNFLRIIPYVTYFLLNFAFLQYFFSILDNYGSLKTLLYVLSVSTIGIFISLFFLPFSAAVFLVITFHKYFL